MNVPALEDGRRSWSSEQLHDEVDRFAGLLRNARAKVLATQLDNSAAWVVADLAAARAGVVHLPLPTFFTRQQRAHALAAAGADALLLNRQHFTADVAGVTTRRTQVVARSEIELIRLSNRAVMLPADTAKVTFTSGSTSAPKGVCLSASAMEKVAEGVALATAPLGIGRHLCALPLALLLENVVGILAPRLRGATILAPPLEELGLNGSSSFDPAVFDRAVSTHRPHSLVLMPQMLRAWVGHLARSGARAPDSLRLVAVGGAAVGAGLIRSARALGIPAYEGYGFTEGGSVQTLNLPGADRPGTVGRPLPHSRVRVSDDGEIECAGSLHLGYLGGRSATADEWWPTGDLGHIDGDGYLHLQGRRKNLLITAFGRNVSPEWIETALKSEPAIAEAVVFGDALPSLRAVLWPIGPAVSDDALQAAVGAANASLPDYARIGRWTRGLERFDRNTGMATANGRPLRDAIAALHAEALGIPASHAVPTRVSSSLQRVDQ
ncbi:MAG TPA: AMP-binding protein [Burkholderiaceae bacterium]|nr:AMP-binding protein [Burkholderiaceae bacterium]